MPDIYTQGNVVLHDVAGIGTAHVCLMGDGTLVINSMDRDGRPKASIRVSVDQRDSLTDWLLDRTATG